MNLISLIQEQLPHYVLRADAATNFAGYDNADWTIQTPCLPQDIDLDLSPEVIEETLKYFVLSGNRLSQMTKTYDDIRAVTHLLEEKERDLELAARIGQKLLIDNNGLNTKVDSLEEQLHQATDKINQLKHVLCVKDALLQAYVQEECDSSESPVQEGSKFGTAAVSVAALQKKVHSLEAENIQLKVETAQLSNETVDYEERESDLIQDCVRQLGEYSERIHTLQEDLYTKTEMTVSLQDKITHLMSQIVTLDKKVHQLTSENAELERRMSASTQTQQELVEEIIDWEERYSECCNLLQEAQEEIRTLQKKQKPGVIRYHYTQMSPYVSSDSLAMELENSIRKNVDFPDGYSPDERRLHSIHVMRTAHAVRRTRGVGSAPCRTGVAAEKLEESGFSSMSISEDHSNNSTKYEDESEADSSRRCRSPESFMSTGSGSFCSDNFSRGMRIPEKLQIVKPMEGSDTLRRWQSLATPHLGRVLEHRPGIQIKGEVGVDVFEEDPYSLSDYEEDDDFSPAFIKCLENTSSTYTFTMSKVAHPSDYYGTSLVSCATVASGFCNSASVVADTTPGVANSATVPEVDLQPDWFAASASPKAQPHWAPPKLGRCTSTFSMSAALAQTLGERGTGLDDDDQRAENVDEQSCGAGWWNKLGFPRRFQNIVTETMCESTHSHTESLYATPGDSRSRSSTDAMKLSERIEMLGRDREARRRSRSNLQRNPVDVGLNTIISIKRSPRNSTNAERKQFDDEHGIVQRQHARPDPKNRDLPSLSGVKRNIIVSNATDKKKISSSDDVSLNFAAFEDRGAGTESGKTDILDAGETLRGTIAIPEILVNSEPVSTVDGSLSLAAHSSASFSWQMPDLPVAKPAGVHTKSSWSLSLKGLTLETCSSSSGSDGRPIVHARVSVAKETN